jgi:hypothetical protein
MRNDSLVAGKIASRVLVRETVRMPMIGQVNLCRQPDLI